MLQAAIMALSELLGPAALLAEDILDFLEPILWPIQAVAAALEGRPIHLAAAVAVVAVDMALAPMVGPPG
jgi:hypothetical protein